MFKEHETMNCLVITGGDAPNAETLRNLAARCQLVIAADSGLDTAMAASILPAIAVGDFDSTEIQLDSLISQGISIVRYPEDKDDTDTEIALKLAQDKGADYIILAGAGGGRLDHLLGVFAMFSRKLHPDEWQTQTDSIFCVPAGTTRLFKTFEQAVVSVFPLGQASSGMRSRNLKWALDGLVWGLGSFGVSNRCLGSEFSISAGTCPLLVITPSGTESF